MNTETVHQHQTNGTAACAASACRKTFVPRCDLCERPDAFVMLADMPGVDEKSVELRIDKNVLTITGQVQAQKREGLDSTWLEYSEGDYRKTFRLTDQVNSGSIEASVKDGVLRVILPKAEKQKPRRIEVKAA